MTKLNCPVTEVDIDDYWLLLILPSINPLEGECVSLVTPSGNCVLKMFLLREVMLDGTFVDSSPSEKLWGTATSYPHADTSRKGQKIHYSGEIHMKVHRLGQSHPWTALAAVSPALHGPSSGSRSAASSSTPSSSISPSTNRSIFEVNNTASSSPFTAADDQDSRHLEDAPDDQSFDAPHIESSYVTTNWIYLVDVLKYGDSYTSSVTRRTNRRLFAPDHRPPGHRRSRTPVFDTHHRADGVVLVRWPCFGYRQVRTGPC